jgi:uncharacterized protein (TIGR02466 family)
MIDMWFPTSIYTNVNPFHNDIKENLLHRINFLSDKIDKGGKNWISQHNFNTEGTFDLCSDPVFDEIKSWITDEVNEFARHLGVDINYKKFIAKTGWFNIYNNDSYQEFHYHSGFTFSAVYFLHGDVDFSPLVFENPLEPDMRPLPIVNSNHFNFGTCKYEFIEGKICIFRSYLRHCVPLGKKNKNRISLAFNFD